MKSGNQRFYLTRKPPLSLEEAFTIALRKGFSFISLQVETRLIIAPLKNLRLTQSRAILTHEVLQTTSSETRGDAAIGLLSLS